MCRFKFKDFDELIRGQKLARAAEMSLRSLMAVGVSKRTTRNQHNKELREKALAQGENPDDLPWEASPKLHSIDTIVEYLRVAKAFAYWVAQNYPDVHTLHYAWKMHLPRAYIQMKIDSGEHSPYSIHKYASALAKLFRVHSWEIHDGKPIRKAKDITRSRRYTLERLAKDIKKYGVTAEIAYFTGVREDTLEKLTPESFVEGADGKLFLPIDGKRDNTKNARPGLVPIVDADQRRLREILASLPPGELICPKAPTHLDVHGIRALYAEKLYMTVARPISEISKDERIFTGKNKKDKRRPNQVRNSVPAIYTRRSDSRKFDRRALFIVSAALLHERDDVAALNYLWRHESPFQD